MVAEFLYHLFVYPIQLVLETVFELFSSWGLGPGPCIIAVSLTVNLLALPLYRRADLLQQEERRKEEELKGWVSHIRKTFRGDERFMMLSAYYRETGYHPAMALRGAVSLLLQIPFFMAAYRCLSGMSALSGASFWIFSDLGKEDAMLSVGGVVINVLPLVMTGINLLSGAVYSKGAPLRQKLSILILALVFLVLLYHSPSGLVFYWTLNNLFSLGKNLVFSRSSLPEPKKPEQREKGYPWLFFSAQLTLALLVGLALPSTLMASSPVEFAEVLYGANPSGELIFPFATALGIFVFWGGVIFLLVPKAWQKGVSFLASVITLLSLAHLLLFQDHFGTLSASLVYEDEMSYELREILIDLVVCVLIIALLILLFQWIRKHLGIFFLMLSVGLFVFSLVNLNRTGQACREAGIEHKEPREAKPLFSLSRTGKNVVVLMLDRGIGGFISYAFYEKPELATSFSGFRWYPNTLSYGGHTNFAVPALFGGYEYTPERINERKEESLKEKHDEALLVLPTLFSEEGYEVTVLDPPYAGYQEVPDLSIYDGLPGVQAHITSGYYETEETRERKDLQSRRLSRKLVSYGLMRISPVAWRKVLYEDGNYHETEGTGYVDPVFLNYYPVLRSMSDLTEVTDEEENTLLVMQNATPHGASILQLPDYTLPLNVDNSGFVTDSRRNAAGELLNTSNYRVERGYDVNMASLLALSDWFQMLKEEGVYDNTRIILVSDHGYDLGVLPSIQTGEDLFDTTFLNPLLMVKDFNAEGDAVVSQKFMTNADVPFLATEGLTEQKNPFTGEAFDPSGKEGEQIVTTSEHYALRDRNTFYTEDGWWLSVTKDVRDPLNWKVLRKGDD